MVIKIRSRILKKNKESRKRVVRVKKDLTFLVALMLTLVSFFAAQEQLTGRVTHDCTDTDGGIEYFTKGTVTVDEEELTDSCQQDALLEYYCSQNQARVKVYICPEGCNEGICQQEEQQGSRESIRIGTNTNQVEIGEYLGDVVDTLTDTRTPALASSTISTGKSTTLANQYIRFKDTDFSSGRILFTEDDHNEVDDFLVFEEDNVTFEYELEFTPGLASNIESNKLVDLEDEELLMLGRIYTIAEAEKRGNRITLNMLAGAIQDTIAEGETKTYTYNGKTYTVKISLIDDAARTVTFSVNNIISGRQKVGDIDLVDNLNVGITRIYVSEASEQEDQATLVLGATLLEFTDESVADDSFTQGISIDGRTLENTYIKIKGTGDTDEYTITSIKYRLKAESSSGADIFIPAGKGLRELTRYPQALLGDWDIKYNGLDAVQTTIKLDPQGSSYDLEASNSKGQRLETTLITNQGGNLKIGDDNTALHFIEGTSTTNFIITQQDSFIVTSGNTRNGITNILKYTGIDTTNKQLFFDDSAEGRKDARYSGTEGTDATADLNVNGNTYHIYIGGAPDYKLAIDLNHDGDVAGDEVNIVVQGGGVLDLGSTITPNDEFNITLTTDASQFDTRTSDEIITISILKSGSDIDLNLPAQTALTIESKTGKRLAMSPYGVFLKQETDNPDELFIQYPLSQATGNIELLFREQQQRSAPQPKKQTEKKEEQKREQPETKIPVQKEEPKPKIRYEEKATGFRAWLSQIIQAILSWF